MAAYVIAATQESNMERLIVFIIILLALFGVGFLVYLVVKGDHVNTKILAAAAKNPITEALLLKIIGLHNEAAALVGREDEAAKAEFAAIEAKMDAALNEARDFLGVIENDVKVAVHDAIQMADNLASKV